MEPLRVLVVGESPSLGRGLAALLEDSGIPTDFVLELAPAPSLALPAGVARPVVVASPGFYCSTLRRWRRGELPGRELVIVGSRDPVLAEAYGAVRVDLPLNAESFLALVRGLATRGARTPRSRRNTGARVAATFPAWDPAADPVRPPVRAPLGVHAAGSDGWSAGR